MKTIAIIALVQNLSAIQLNDRFVSLSQSQSQTKNENNELGILGASPEMGELGGIPGMGSSMDELGGLPAPLPAEGVSMKNVQVGAPPAGFADFMKKKAEAAAAEKQRLQDEKSAKLKAMRAAQIAKQQAEIARIKAEADATAAQKKHEEELAAAVAAEKVRQEKEAAEAKAAAELAAAAAAAQKDADDAAAASKKEEAQKAQEKANEVLKSADTEKFNADATAQIGAQTTIKERIKADAETKALDIAEEKEIIAKDKHDQAEFMQIEAEKQHDLEVRKSKVADSLKTWEDQQFALSVEQDRANFEEEDRENKAQNQQFAKLDFTMAQDNKRADDIAVQKDILKHEYTKQILEKRKADNAAAIEVTRKKEAAVLADLEAHSAQIRASVKDSLDEVNNSSEQQDKIIMKNRKDDKPEIAKIQEALAAQEKINDAAAEKKEIEQKAADEKKAAADKKDQTAKMEEASKNDKENDTVIKKELAKNKKSKTAIDKGEEVADEEDDDLAKKLGAQGTGDGKAAEEGDKKAAAVGAKEGDKKAAAKKGDGEEVKEGDKKEAADGDAKKPAAKKEGDAKKQGGDAKKEEGGDAKKKEGGDAKKKEGGDAKKAEGADAKKEGGEDAKKAEGAAEEEVETPAQIAMKKIEAQVEQIVNDKPAGSPETPKRDKKAAIKKIADDEAKVVKDTQEKAAKKIAVAPKAEKSDALSFKLVPALAVDGTVMGSSKYHLSDAEIWTENMPLHVQDYNGGLGSTTYSNSKYVKPWGADIE